MAFKIFNIGKANEEIVRLESEIARLNTELTAAKENATQLEGAAQEAATNLTAAQTEITKLKTTVSELAAVKQSLADMTTAHAMLKAIIDKPDGEIEKRASAKAIEIAAQQGAAVIEIKGTDETKTESEGKTFAEKALIAAQKKATARG